MEEAEGRAKQNIVKDKTELLKKSDSNIIKDWLELLRTKNGRFQLRKEWEMVCLQNKNRVDGEYKYIGDKGRKDRGQVLADKIDRFSNKESMELAKEILDVEVTNKTDEVWYYLLSHKFIGKETIPNIKSEIIDASAANYIDNKEKGGSISLNELVSWVRSIDVKVDGDRYQIE